MNLEAELLEAADEAVCDLGAGSSIEVVSAEVVVLDAVTEHVVRRGRHGGSYREDDFLGTSTTLQAQELRAQIAIPFGETQPMRPGPERS